MMVEVDTPIVVNAKTTENPKQGFLVLECKTRKPLVIGYWFIEDRQVFIDCYRVRVFEGPLLKDPIDARNPEYQEFLSLLSNLEWEDETEDEEDWCSSHIPQFLIFQNQNQRVRVKHDYDVNSFISSLKEGNILVCSDKIHLEDVYTRGLLRI